MINDDRCCVCGGYVPEGRMICKHCEQQKDFEFSYISLREFVCRFVGHETFIYLYDSNSWRPDLYNEPVWKGLDFQISASEYDKDYFLQHPEIEICPYLKCNVVQVHKVMTDNVRDLGIVIDIPQNQLVKELIPIKINSKRRKLNEEMVYC